MVVDKLCAFVSFLLWLWLDVCCVKFTILPFCFRKKQISVTYFYFDYLSCIGWWCLHYTILCPDKNCTPSILHDRKWRPILIIFPFLAYSLEWAYTIMRRPSSSVCPSVRSKQLLLLGKWTDPHQTSTQWSPGQSTSRLCSGSRSRSKVTRYGQFCSSTEIASSPRQMDRSSQNFFTSSNITVAQRRAWNRNELLRHRRSGYSQWSSAEIRDV